MNYRLIFFYILIFCGITSSNLHAQQFQKSLDHYMELFTWEEVPQLKKAMEEQGIAGDPFFVMNKNNLTGYIQYRDRLEGRTNYTLIIFATNKPKTDLIMYTADGFEMEYGFYEASPEAIEEVSNEVLPLADIAVEYNHQIERWAFSQGIDIKKVTHFMSIDTPTRTYQIGDLIDVTVNLIAKDIPSEKIKLGALRFNGFGFEYQKIKAENY